jgi:transposase-like protein
MDRDTVQPVGKVTCPGCNKQMRPVERKPIRLSRGLVEVTYRCDSCGMETNRTIKED